MKKVLSVILAAAMLFGMLMVPAFAKEAEAVRGTPPQPMRVFEAAGLPQVMVFERGKE